MMMILIIMTVFKWRYEGYFSRILNGLLFFLLSSASSKYYIIIFVDTSTHGAWFKTVISPNNNYCKYLHSTVALKNLIVVLILPNDVQFTS